MEIFKLMVDTQLLYLLYIAVGFVVSICGIVKEAGRKALANVLMYVAMPCLIFKSFYGGCTVEELKDAANVLIISACVNIGGYILGRIVFRRAQNKPVYVFGTAFSNAGNAGLVVITAVYGARGTVSATVYLLPVVVLLWTLGLSLFVKGDGRIHWKEMLLSPTMIAMAAGLIALASGIKLPGILESAVGSFSAMTPPMVMMIVGMNLAGVRPRQMLRKNVLVLCTLRLIVIPLLLFGALKLIHVPDMVMFVAVTVAAMPVASNDVVLAEKYGIGEAEAGSAVALSTVLSAVTVSLITLLMQMTV